MEHNEERYHEDYRQKFEDAKHSQDYLSNKKSVLIAYIILCFLGSFGIQRLYLGDRTTFKKVLACFLISIFFIFASFLFFDTSRIVLFLCFAISFFSLGYVVLRSILDIFIIPKLVDDYNSKLLGTVVADIATRSRQVATSNAR